MRACIVVRHLSPSEEDIINDRADESDCDDNEIAKRPCLKLQVCIF